MPILELQNIAKSYLIAGSAILNVLSEVNLTVNPGETIAILGASGSGKSTLLHIAAMLDDPSSGSVIIDNIDIKYLNNYQKSDLRLKKIGFIYQFHHLLEEFNVCMNVAMPLLIAGENKGEALKKAEKILSQIGILEKSQSFPSELSGGQKQRVAIARALVNNPSIILADEPTGNLDPVNAEQMFYLLNSYAKNNKVGLVVITHNDLLAKMLDKNLRLRDGKLYLI